MKRPCTVICLMALLAGMMGGGMGCRARLAAQREAPGSAGGVKEAVKAPQLPAGWFLRQRRGRRGSLPLMARGRALQEARARGELSVAPGSWIVAGPANIGGRITALGVDPANADHLWLGSAEGGVFTSTDAGATWSPVFEDQTALSIGSIAVDPTDSNTVIVGTGEDNGGGFSYDGEGVLKTTNGGLTWTNLGLAEVRRIGRVAVDPFNPARVFVAAGGDWFNRDANRGIYRSTDSGASWEKVLFVADDAGGIDVAIDPGMPNRI